VVNKNSLKKLIIILFFSNFLISCQSAFEKNLIESGLIQPGVRDLEAEYRRVGPGLVSREWANIWGLPSRNWLPAESVDRNLYSLEAGSLQSAYLGASQYCGSRQMSQKQAVPGGFSRATIIFECR
jgi:hypothetical protein